MKNLTKAGRAAFVGTVTATLVECEEKVNALKNSIITTAQAAWTADGGCVACEGHGTWYGRAFNDDWSSYHRCERCDGNSSNPKPTSVQMAQKSYPALVLAEVLEFDELSMKLIELQHDAKPEKGKKGRVIAGRKAPIGTEGVISWAGRTKYGSDSALIETVDGAKHWVDFENLAIVAMTDEEKKIQEQKAQEQEWSKAVAQDWVLETFPTMPRLEGSVKQVAWAEKIRTRLALGLKETPDAVLAQQIATIASAKHWIDREMAAKEEKIVDAMYRDEARNIRRYYTR